MSSFTFETRQGQATSVTIAVGDVSSYDSLEVNFYSTRSRVRGTLSKAVPHSAGKATLSLTAPEVDTVRDAASEINGVKGFARTRLVEGFVDWQPTDVSASAGLSEADVIALIEDHAGGGASEGGYPDIHNTAIVRAPAQITTASQQWVTVLFPHFNHTPILHTSAYAVEATGGSSLQMLVYKTRAVSANQFRFLVGPQDSSATIPAGTGLFFNTKNIPVNPYFNIKTVANPVEVVLENAIDGTPQQFTVPLLKTAPNASYAVQVWALNPVNRQTQNIAVWDEISKTTTEFTVEIGSALAAGTVLQFWYSTLETA